MSKFLNDYETVVLLRNLADGFNQSVHVNQTKSVVTDKQPHSEYKHVSLFPADIQGFAAILLFNFDSR